MEQTTYYTAGIAYLNYDRTLMAIPAKNVLASVVTVCVSPLKSKVSTGRIFYLSLWCLFLLAVIIVANLFVIKN